MEGKDAHGYDLIATNTSTRDCRIYGYPIVKLTSSKSRVGRMGEPIDGFEVHEVILRPGAGAKATIVLEPPTSGCQWTNADEMQAQVPNSTASATWPLRASTCKDRSESLLKVSAFTPA